MEKSYSGTWMFFFSKNHAPGSTDGTNDISFQQKIPYGNAGISYDIEMDQAGFIHISGYISDPVEEVRKIIDFKKVK